MASLAMLELTVDDSSSLATEAIIPRWHCLNGEQSYQHR